MPCKMGNREFESDYHHRPHFLAIQLFQTEIFGDCQLFSFTFWVRVKHSHLQKLKSIAVQAVYRQDVNKMWGRVEHLPEKSASNILAMKKNRKIFVFFKFHFHNDGRPRETSYFEVFSRHEVIYLCVKFQVSLTCPTGFLPANTTFFTNIWREYFFPNILRVFDQPEVEFSKSGQNWANTKPLLLKTFESSNCVDRHIVKWLKGVNSSSWEDHMWKFSFEQRFEEKGKYRLF